MVSLPIRRIEARTFCHATEEDERVATALAFACPEGETSREPLEGYFGNALIRLTRRVEKAAAIRTVWERWTAAGLPAWIAKDVEARIDEDGFLHFRLGKHAAHREALEGAGDSHPIDIRGKLIPFPAKPEEIPHVRQSGLPGAT